MARHKFDLSGWASQAELAYTVILDRILRGHLPVGTPISRRSVAEELNLGLQPVTEALQRLEVDGLVESRPRVGTRIRLPTAQELRGHSIVREALESQSARLFAEKASAAERNELTALAERLDRLFEAPGDSEHRRKGNDYWYEVRQQHSRFHLRIAECTGCQQLCDAMKKNQILIFNGLYDVLFGKSALPEGWHGRLLEGLNSGSVEQADTAMRQHVRYGMDRLIEHMNQLPHANEDSASSREASGLRPSSSGQNSR